MARRRTLGSHQQPSTSSVPDIHSYPIDEESPPVKADISYSNTSHHRYRFRVHAGAPQLIRVAGFRDVFERYYNRLDQATCSFGVNHQVDCRCDTLHGTIECDVPRSKPSTPQSHDDSVLVVKAQIAEFQTPPLAFKYSALSCDQRLDQPTESTPHRRPENVFDDSTASSISSHPERSETPMTHVQPATKPEANNRNSSDPDDSTKINQNNLQQSSLHSRVLSIISRERSKKDPGKPYMLLHECIAELIGTMFIVVFGVGSVCSAVLLKDNVPLWHIATVWGFGVALAILATASVSGAHLNPAVSLALAMFRPGDFPFNKLLPYWCAQYLGGIIGGAFNLMIFGPSFDFFEAKNNIIRNEIIADFGSSGINTARAFGEYFPAPGGALPENVISPAFAMLVEAWGTGILMFIILALTDPRQKIMRSKEMLPFYIGFTVAVLITLYAPLTQAGWNPARDFGPRVVAALAGWGRVAIPGPRNGFWVYIIGPKIGAPIGALVYDFLIRPGLYD